MELVVILLLVGLATWFWLGKTRDGGGGSNSAGAGPHAVTGAARHLNYHHRQDRHPVDCIDEQNIAIGALATAILELGGSPGESDRSRMNIALRTALRISAEDADQVAILGRWMIGQCRGAAQSVTRLGTRLYLLTGPRGMMHLGEVVEAMFPGSAADMSPQQKRAMYELKHIFRA